MDELLRIAHIIGGGGTLVAFLVPMIAKKGGRVHVLAGRMFAGAMALAVVAALTICARRLADDDAGNDLGALFLAYVGVLAAVATLTGIRIIRTRRRPPPRYHRLDIAASAVLLAGGLALAALGLARGRVLLVAFGVLGALLAGGQLRYWLRPPPDKRAWWYEHMTAMLSACIGTVTAFLVVNVPRFGLERYALWFWLAPGVLGGIGITVWQLHYRKRFARGHDDAALAARDTAS